MENHLCRGVAVKPTGKREGKSLLSNETVSRFLRFCLAGGAASVLYFVIASGLTFFFGMQELSASVLAYLFCILVSYFLQRRFTFRSSGKKQIEMPRFILVSVSGLLFSSAIVYFNTAVLQISPYISFTLVLVLIPVINYVLFSRYVFR